MCVDQDIVDLTTLDADGQCTWQSLQGRFDCLTQEVVCLSDCIECLV